jgi:hypothetical protein
MTLTIPSGLPGLATPLVSMANTQQSVATANPNPINSFLSKFAPSVAKAAGIQPTPTPAPTNAAAPSAPGGGLTPSAVANPVPGATTSTQNQPTIPPPPPPPTTQTSGQYTPGDVAIGSTVLPNGSPRLGATQGALDSAASSLAGVDRTKLAQQMFDTFAQSTQPAYDASLRDATRYAAGAGRIGSGQLRTSYGNLADQRNRQLSTAQQQLTENALEGSIGDQFNKVSALSGLEGQQYGEGQDANNQLRAERGYQTGLGQQAFENAMAQWRQQQSDQGQAFGQSATQAQLIASLKQAGVDPSIIATLSKSIGSQPSTGTARAPSTPIPPGYIYDGGNAVLNNVG